jgi:hypothetical protein
MKYLEIYMRERSTVKTRKARIATFIGIARLAGCDFGRDDHNKNKQYHVTMVTAKEQKA